MFVGKWNLEGRQLEGIVGPAAKVAAVQTYEWLTGGFFLIHRFEGRVGNGEAACIEIIAYDHIATLHYAYFLQRRQDERMASICR